MRWEQITSKYEGLFFRAEGNNSAVFNGGVQQENSPRLISLHSEQINKSKYHVVGEVRLSSNVVFGGRSSPLYAGDVNPTTTDFMRLLTNHSGGEVRPRNEAIRIWKRIS